MKLPGVLKGKTKDGLAYLNNQRYTFNPYFTDGRIELTNNRAERSIKPFVMRRKNFLFCNTPSGADSAVTIFSLIETAKLNDLDLYEYLFYILKKAPGMTAGDIDTLLPWNVPGSYKLTGAK